MLFRGTVVEVQLKPSKPPGRQGSDAFGRRLSAFQDRGLRKRAILNFGFLDTDAFGLTPRNHLAEIITSNSDYTVLDVTDCDPPISVGDVLEFDMNYHAMIQGFMSPYVSKRLLESV
jgi:predicted amino acid racemase